ncbi:sugar transferase [Candidatus Bipolaricaulota bacterium]|nr:sugar transferase [Candidatus Bipolaricaulota bacterium]
MDIVFSSVMLLLLLIPFVLIAAAIKLDDGGSVFFRQERIGKSGVPFRVWKFRTMVENAESHALGVLTTAADPRITRLGRILRRLGFDELLQLVNVLAGQMSLVGPRPTVARQVKRYTAHQRRRLEVKPGLTGWALIHGRNALTWPEKIELDVWYVEHQSLWIDLRVLLTTPRVVLSGKGLYLEKTDEILSGDETGR